MTWLDDLTLNTVIVHTTHGGPSLKGVKAAVHEDCIVLRSVMTLEDPPALLNGDVVVPRERVLMMQLVAHDDA